MFKLRGIPTISLLTVAGVFIMYVSPTLKYFVTPTLHYACACFKPYPRGVVNAILLVGSSLAKGMRVPVAIMVQFMYRDGAPALSRLLVLS